MTTYAKEMGAITRVLELFVNKETEIDADRKVLDISAARCLVFSVIMESPGISSRDIERRLNMNAAYVSRHVQALSKFEKPGRPGPNLIESYIDPQDTRRKCHFLTPAGRAFAERPVGTVANRGDARIEGENTPETLRQQWTAGSSRDA